MPALPFVPKVVRVDHHMVQTGNRSTQIREFYQYAGTLNTADAATWLAAILAAFNTFVNGNLSTDLTTVLHELTDLSSASAPQVLNSTGATGGVAGTAVPAAVAMVIRHHIVRRYRGGKSRVYIPGNATSSLLNSTTWTTAALASIVGQYTTYINSATTTPGGTAIGAITHVNVSYFQGFVNHTFPSGRVKPIPSLRATPLVDAIVNISGNATVGSQRRRNEQSL